MCTIQLGACSFQGCLRVTSCRTTKRACPDWNSLAVISESPRRPLASRQLPSSFQPASSANMKSTTLLLPLYTAALAAAVSQPKDAQVILQDPQLTIVEPDEYLIELSPGETRWVTEDEKWELRKVCCRLWHDRQKSRLTIGSKTSTSSTSRTTRSSAR